jgi:uncharacterized protein (UPF0276 family)
MRRMSSRSGLGLGIGWRPPLALAIERRRDLGFVEIIAESFDLGRPPPRPLEQLRRRGVAVIPHGIQLSLGGADPPDPKRLAALAHLAERLDAPLVSEHVAFVRADGVEIGHLMPVPRTRAALEVMVANVKAACAALPVPLALENVASLVQWPDPEMEEGDFLTELLDRTGALLLLDLENVYANACNHGFDARTVLGSFPLGRLAYIHVAGGLWRDGLYHDTHTQPVPEPVFDLLESLAARVHVPGVMLERDDDFPDETGLNAELDRLHAAVARGATRRGNPHVAV